MGSAARRSAAARVWGSAAAAAPAAAAAAAAEGCCCCYGAWRPVQRKRRARSLTMARARLPGARRWHRA
eukprot:scaffold92282_cov75-Phaeocystis_antarctica.AAC.3